jgi:hypothetical protein
VKITQQSFNREVAFKCIGEKAFSSLRRQKIVEFFIKTQLDFGYHKALHNSPLNTPVIEFRKQQVNPLYPVELSHSMSVVALHQLRPFFRPW